MLFPTRQSLAVAALSAASLVSAQTPAGAPVTASTALGLQFNKTVINPDGLLISQSLADAGAPVVSSTTKYSGEYTFLLVDLSIPYSVVNTTHPKTLVPGIGTNRTTRLHWWMDQVTQGSNGVFTGASTLADYEGPQPPPGDIPHDYTMYLFKRPASFKPIPNAEAFYDASTFNGDDRMNFSLPALAQQLGQPVAARYFRVQNTGNAASPNTSTSNTTSSTAPSTNSTAISNATTASSTPSVTPYNPENSAPKSALSLSLLGLVIGAATWLC